MNLKRTLRALYADQPPLETKRFAKRLLHDAAWQQLHPIRAAIFTHAWLSATLMTVSALAIAGTGVGMIGILLRSAPTPELESPSLSEPPTIVSDEAPQTTATLPTSAPSTDASEPTASTAPEPTAATAASSAAAQTMPAAVTTPSMQTPPVQTAPAASETEAETAPVSSTEAPTFPREVVTASLCRHDAVPLDLLNFFIDETLTDYEFCGYPEYNATEKLKLTDAQFLDWAVFLSEDILMGTILSKEESVICGKPWTCLTLQVDETLRGASDDTVQVWMAGGTMPLAEYLAVYPTDDTFADWDAERIANADLYEQGAFSREYAVGESYLWFLRKDSIAPKGTPGIEDMVSVTTFGSDVTILCRDGGSFVCANPYQSFRMEEQTLLQQVQAAGH